MSKTTAGFKYQNNLHGWIVCISASLFFFYYFVQIMAFNTISPGLIKTFSLNAASFGVLSSLALWGGAIFVLPVGILLDHFSVKKIIFWALFVTTLGTFVFSLAQNLLVAQCARFFVGIGSCGAFLPCIKLASRWFSSNRLAMVSGIILTVGFLGGMVGQTPMVLLVNAFGWRSAIFIDGVFGVLLLTLMFFVIQDYPSGTLPVEKPHDFASFIRNLKVALFNRETWLYGLYICLLNLPIFVLGAAFGNHYLQQSFHLSEVQASFSNTLLIFGVIIAAPILGWWSDKMGRRKPLMIAFAIISIVLMLVIMYVPAASPHLVYVLFFLVGFSTTVQIIGYPAIAESNPSNVISTSTSVASTITLGGGAFFMSLFGWLLTARGPGKLIHGVLWHSVAEYRFAMWLLPMAFFVGLIAVLFAKETYCKGEV